MLNFAPRKRVGVSVVLVPLASLSFGWLPFATADDAPASSTFSYDARLTPIKNPQPILNDHPDWVEPVRETNRFEAKTLIDEEGADLEVRAWRWSYNARAIIEVPNRLKASATAVIMVHPWGTDDGQGWNTPQPAGAADFCTPEKNALAGKHTREVVVPFIKSLRGKAALVGYSLSGDADPIRTKLYRTINGRPTDEERKEAKKAQEARLKGFNYNGGPLPEKLEISRANPVADYLKQFPGLDAGPKYNPQGFWELGIPLSADTQADPDDVVLLDNQGYPAFRDFLKKNGVRHVLLTGYCTDMCFKATTAGYVNLSPDFNVFLVGDATLATFPSNPTPRFATNAEISFAALDHLVTQISWVKYTGTAGGGR